VRSLAHVLGQTVGRTFQATCDAALGDGRCGVDLEDSAYKGTGAVIDLLRDRAFTASGLGGFNVRLVHLRHRRMDERRECGSAGRGLGHDLTDGIAVLTLLEAPVRASPRAMPSPSARAATSAWRPAARSSPTPSISEASRISPARTRFSATPPRTAATRGRCCECRRSQRVIAIARSWLGHAYERLGVIEEPLTQSWRRRIAFAFLFPQR
jgi:hypothetical protein